MMNEIHDSGTAGENHCDRRSLLLGAGWPQPRESPRRSPPGRLRPPLRRVARAKSA